VAGINRSFLKEKGEDTADKNGIMKVYKGVEVNLNIR
jgi:hypothetical protein